MFQAPVSAARGVARGQRFVLLASRFHPAIARSLVRGASRLLRHAGVASSHIRLFWVPGAFELPVVAARVAKGRGRPDAIIALGALIRGDTPQYEVIAHAVAQGLTQVSVETGIPVAFGVVVATTLAQAKARAGLPAAPGRRGRRAAQAGGSLGNRGEEAAMAAINVLQLFQMLR